jgi:hypothetical protein
MEVSFKRMNVSKPHLNRRGLVQNILSWLTARCNNRLHHCESVVQALSLVPVSNVQMPPKHVWLLGHATQALPLTPQAFEKLPATHLPDASQHPL